MEALEGTRVVHENRPTVFISYSHKDAEWEARVVSHLMVLQELLAPWHDLNIGPGADWKEEIERALDEAGVAVLLISANFLSSEFIRQEEVPRLLRRWANGSLHLIPVLISPCDWEAIGWLRRLQFHPRGAHALSKQSAHAVDTELASLARELRLLTSGSVQEASSKQWVPPPDVSISRLPITGEHLFGRERELALLDGAWADPDTHMLSIVAWGGIGKSSLVNQWLGRFARDRYRGARRVYAWSFYSQGIHGTTALADDFISATLKRLGDPSPPGQGSAWERGERLARLIQQERMLLILDGMEPLQSSPGPQWGRLRDSALSVLVRELAFFNPGLCIITSRVPVADIEHFRRTTAPVVELEGLSEEAGAELLRNLQVRGSQLELEQASLELGGHGLTLSLLGTYLRDACEGDVRARRELHFFDEGQGVETHAERMLQSYEHWFAEEGPELAVLRLLGLFDRPVERQWVDVLREPIAIPGLTTPLEGLRERAWQRTLSQLRQARLLAEVDPLNPGTLDTHPLIRGYFRRQLKTRFPEAWRQGHHRLYEYFSRSAVPLPSTSEERTLLQLAVMHGCQAGHHQEVFEQVFLLRLLRGVNLRTVAPEVVDRAGEDLAALAHFFDPPWRNLPPTLPDELKIRVQTETAGYLILLGHISEAVEPLLGALKLCLSQGDRGQVSVILEYLCRVHFLLGELPAAIHYGERAVARAREEHIPPWQEAVQLASLAWALFLSGRLEEAEERFRHADSIPMGAERVNFLTGELLYWMMLLDQGRSRETLQRIEPYVDWARSTGSQLLIGLIRMYQGIAYLRQGPDSPEALTLSLDALNEGLHLMWQLGTPVLMSFGLEARAAVHRLRGEFEQAWKDVQEAMFIAIGSGMQLAQADLHLESSRLHLAMGHNELARAELDAARKMIARTGYHRRDRELAELETRLTPAERREPGTNHGQLVEK
ncbi:TIR domain-containing protein [Vitiosangium sp. GDMCC 1.1324]|uniref:TIR domain-containing protein n=1 Tax=Vitiosangium sp. (strain GDMCC 1.1324) TaxID=2138576 RepID=UPI000D3CFE0D|nr:TIR domain-containing protein [Vitiosangium sp. GDMCC 1.1324]PTL82230.1 hypothetical protein DAT35_20795 [Vitiosangium sp. GDMCC 1.1324]